MSEAAEVPVRLAEVKARITQAARAAGRGADEVRLVAVSKRQPDAKVQAAFDAGQRDFGENYAQALEARAAAFPPEARWHMIGPLQRNKAKKVAVAAAMVHSVDSEALARALARAAEARPAPLPVLLQVNAAGEASKAGLDEGEVEAVAVAILGLPSLRLDGLMCIPPPGEGPVWFERLARLRERLAGRLGVPLPELSMGMSADFEAAVAAGATLVRVGTDVFGERNLRNP